LVDSIGKSLLHANFLSNILVDDGTALFLDVFRRADKNDDGKVSLTEFTSYFEDEHLSNVEMNQLFDQIDTDNSKNIDLEGPH
jgi:Ca2+-binding EF-hand superfamily protein